MDKQKNMEEMIKRGETYQALYEKVVKNNQKLGSVLGGLDEMSQEIIQLLRYYQGDWINDRDDLGDHPVRDNLMFAEDPIYDEVQEWDSLLEQLQKKAGALLETFRAPN